MSRHIDKSSEATRAVRLDGFMRKGLGYERTGFGDRSWRICRFRDGFRVQLEALEPPLACIYGRDLEEAAGKPLVDEFAVSLSEAVRLARSWDERLDR